MSGNRARPSLTRAHCPLRSYLRAFFASYALLLRDRVTLTPGYQRIGTVDDVRRFTHQCECADSVTDATRKLSRELACSASVAPPSGVAQPVGAAPPCCRGWDCATDVCAAAAHERAGIDLNSELQLGVRELHRKLGTDFLAEPPSTSNPGAYVYHTSGVIATS